MFNLSRLPRRRSLISVVGGRKDGSRELSSGNKDKKNKMYLAFDAAYNFLHVQYLVATSCYTRTALAAYLTASAVSGFHPSSRNQMGLII